MDIRARTKLAATAMQIAIIALAVAAASAAAPAAAGGSRYAAGNDIWQAECASCHIAYPPQLLPAASWQRLMAGLEKHFGADASVEAVAAAEIGRFLEANAARGKRARQGAGELRITRTAWFSREHDEVPAQTWSSPAVRSASNCTACHSLAERGDFSERNVRIPR